MKHFFKNELKKVLSGVSLCGFSKDGLVVFIDSLCRFVDCRVLMTSDSEDFIKTLFDQSRFFKNSLLYYPEPPKGEIVPGFQAAHNLIRSQALIGLSSSSGSVCLASSKAVGLQIINKKKGLRSISVYVGEALDRDFLCRTLSGFSFKVVDCVYNPGEMSIRGDIVDVFPENIKNPLRLSFDFGVLGSLSSFNVETQKRASALPSFVFYDSIGGVVELGRSLLDFVVWDHLITIVENGAFYNLIIGKGDKKEVVFFNNPYNKKLTKKSFEGFLTNPVDQPTYVFYTNKKRKNKIKKFGAVPVFGLIKNPFKTNLVAGIFIPDFKTKLKSTTTATRIPLKNNSLAFFGVGDYVVHVLHGVGQFRGLVIRGPAGFEKEYIKITYREGGVLFVPMNKFSLVHKYRGFGVSTKINKLGGGGWKNNVSKTKKEIEKISSFLVDLHVSRTKPRSFMYEPLGDLDFAIKQSFPHNETKDQKSAIADVLGDLEKTRPMNRLICGDVGFGKTEVALRAVVRVASSTKQVIFLCPTTVLSDQHYITARARLEPLGIRVGLLSRFQTKTKQSKTLSRVLGGNIDLIIGTHRLLSEDVVVPNLGLLIVDEEHRFGVKHKEKIRALKTGLDVMSLSATPIPRTLQQSILGIRDISKIETPPTRRKPINTSVEFFSWRRSVEIIETELLRGGQVYFLHNRVRSIAYQTEKLRGYFPKEKIKHIHGQQDSRTLEKNLLDFFDGKISVLVCSTIIESGLDVSNANCIIINNPQELGLSQLYQIRGRVGRGSRQAHCYLFVPKKTKLSEKAFQRLKTIERHTSLGSGYNISNKDLDIRGAGAVFGYKQSGQITRVGLEYYNDLLKRAIVEKTNNKKVVSAVDVVFFGNSLIPQHYISNEEIRLSFYAKINTAEKNTTLLAVKSELIDRFGELPPETKAFINLTSTRLLFRDTPTKVITINKKSIVFEMFGEDLGPNTVNKILEYENGAVLNKTFKQGSDTLLVFFEVLEGYDWFALVVDCNSLFYNQ